jgi:RNA polymerase sigma-70 factor (ECF subfamily)
MRSRMVAPSDFELLEAWRGGDRTAGNALFDRYFEALYRFFRNKVDDAPEDLVQQTFLALLQAKDGFRGESSFRTYLFVAARSKLYNQLERRRREGGVIDWTSTSCADLGVSPSGLVDAREQQVLLLNALRRLPVDLQIALELYYFEQIRGPELAEILGVPEGTARSRIRRGLELLREGLEQLSRSPADVESTMGDLDGWADATRQAMTAARRARG